MKTMVLDGNAKVGQAKVYQTQLEFQQAKEIELLKDMITDGYHIMLHTEAATKVRSEYKHRYINYCEWALEILKTRKLKGAKS